MIAKVIGIVSIKGGVGKTTAAVNLGAALADFGKKVLLVDADFGSPNLALHLGLVRPKKTLDMVFKGKLTAYEAIHSYLENLDILPCSLMADRVNPFMLKEKLEGVRNLYDYIVIDAAPTLNDEMLATIVASDELLVVTSPDYPTLSATLHAVKVAKKEKTPIAGLLLNRVRGKKFELTTEEIEEAADVAILGVVREDLTVPQSVAETMPAMMFKPRAKAVRSFKKIAADLIGIEYDDSFWSQLKNVFKRKDKPEDGETEE